MGAATRKEIRVITGLDADIVDLCVDLLVVSGEIRPTELKGACTVGGCSSCGEDSTCHPREANQGPVTITITKRLGI
jgi:hypothetical protein